MLSTIAIAAAQTPQSEQTRTVRTATISGTVLSSDSKPLSGVTVTLAGPVGQVTKTDERGSFIFSNVPYGTYSLTAHAKDFGEARRSDITVNGDVDVSIALSKLQTENIKTIGTVVTHAVNGQINLTDVPVTTITQDTFAERGEQSIRRVLETLPGVSTASFQGLFTTAVPDSPIAPQIIALDGCLPYETATRLDGMPLQTLGYSATPGGGVDLSEYGPSSFNQVEIVRGASANSTSILGAVCGTVNLRTPGSVGVNHFDLSLGTDPYGGINNFTHAALRLGKLSTTINYQFSDSPSPSSGGKFAAFTPTFATVDGQPFSCTGPCALQFTPSTKYANLFNVSQGLLACCFNSSEAWSQHSGSLSLAYQFSPRLTGQLFYAGNDTNSANLAGTIFQTQFTPASSYSGPIPPGPFQAPYLNPQLVPISESSSLLEERFSVQSGNGILTLAGLQSYSAEVQNLLPAPPAVVALYGTGLIGTASTPITFNGDSHLVTYPQVTVPFTAWSDSRDLLFSYYTPISERFHVTGSYVRGFYNEPYTGSVISPGSPPFFFSLNDDVDQSTDEYRLAFGGDIAPKVTLELSEYLTALKYHLQDPTDPTGARHIDERFNYDTQRMSLLWHPNINTAVRASAGGSFVPAPLGDLLGPNGVPFPNSFTSPTFYTNNVVNLGLRPENAFGSDLGADYRVGLATIVSADVYRTNLYGQFYTQTTLAGTYNSLPLYDTKFENLGTTRFQGAFASVKHSPGVGIVYNAAVGFTRAYLLDVPQSFYATPFGPKTANLYVLPIINFNGSFAAAIPYSQASGSIGYRWSAERFATVDSTYYGPNNSYLQPAFVVVDANVRIPLTASISAQGTLRNITGRYDSPIAFRTPPYFAGAPTVAGLPQFTPTEVYGPRTFVFTVNYHI